MNIDFRTNELNAYEYHLLQAIEQTSDVLKVCDFITRRAVVAPDPVALLNLPMPTVYRLFNSAACMAVKATAEACSVNTETLPSQENEEAAIEDNNILAADLIG